MIEETAKVIAVDKTKRQVMLEIQRKSSCGQCIANQSCGTAVLQKVLGRRNTRLLLPYEVALDVDDSVILGLPDKALVKGAFAVYAIPLLLMIAFALVGEIVGEQLSVTSVDSISVGSALFGLLGGLIWLQRYSNQISSNRQYQPRILRKIPHSL